MDSIELLYIHLRSVTELRRDSLHKNLQPMALPSRSFSEGWRCVRVQYQPYEGIVRGFERFDNIILYAHLRSVAELQRDSLHKNLQPTALPSRSFSEGWRCVRVQYQPYEGIVRGFERFCNC